MAAMLDPPDKATISYVANDFSVPVVETDAAAHVHSAVALSQLTHAAIVARRAFRDARAA